MRKLLFDRLSAGDNERDAILEDILNKATDEQIEFALSVAEQGHSDVLIFHALNS